MFFYLTREKNDFAERFKILAGNQKNYFIELLK